MTRFEKRLLWGATITVAVTGIVYMWVKYGFEPAQPWDAVNHPLQPWILKLHIVAAPVLVFAVGLVTTRHIWRHYREGMPLGRRSGIITALVTAPMVVSGYLIQAVTNVGWLRAMVWAHVATSFVYLIGMGVHRLTLRARTRGVKPRRAARKAAAV